MEIFLNKTNVLLDSGSTYSYFPAPVLTYDISNAENREIQESIIEFCLTNDTKCKGTLHSQSPLCYKMDTTEVDIQNALKSFPNIEFDISDNEIIWGPQEYFIPNVGNPLLFCLGAGSDSYI